MGAERAYQAKHVVIAFVYQIDLHVAYEHYLSRHLATDMLTMFSENWFAAAINTASNYADDAKLCGCSVS